MTMNWQQFTDKIVGNKGSFSNAEVRAIVRKTLEYCSDNWINHRR